MVYSRNGWSIGPLLSNNWVATKSCQKKVPLKQWNIPQPCMETVLGLTFPKNKNAVQRAQTNSVCLFWAQSFKKQLLTELPLNRPFFGCHKNAALWISHGIRPKWQPIPYKAHYVWPEPYGPWAKVVHYIGCRIPFGTHSGSPTKQSPLYPSRDKRELEQADPIYTCGFSTGLLNKS